MKAQFYNPNLFLTVILVFFITILSTQVYVNRDKSYVISFDFNMALD